MEERGRVSKQPRIVNSVARKEPTNKSGAKITKTIAIGHHRKNLCSTEVKKKGGGILNIWSLG